MLTIINYEDAESIVMQAQEDFKLLIIEPNIINKIQLYLTFRIKKGVQIFGVGPFAMRSFYSLLQYGKLVENALKSKYKVYIKKEGNLFQKGEWYIVFKL